MPIYLHLTPDEMKHQRETNKVVYETYDRHAQSLGMLCMAWATLDRNVDRLFEPLLNCSAEQVASLMTNVENISSRCDMLRRLLIKDHPSQAYREWLSGLLDRVSGELAPLRNRYIHDQWSIRQEGMTRIDKRAKVGKPQARQQKVITFDTEHVATPNDVDHLRDCIAVVMVMLSYAEHDLRVWRRTGRLLEPDPQYIEACKQNARWMNPQEHEEALRQGLPTSGFVFG